MFTYSVTPLSVASHFQSELSLMSPRVDKSFVFQPFQKGNPQDWEDSSLDVLEGLVTLLKDFQ